MKKLTPRDAEKIQSLSQVSDVYYDVVIVGSGISGSIIANAVGEKDKNYKVLIIEAGTQDALDIKGYEELIETFYTALSKDNNAPYKRNPNAPMPRSTDVVNPKVPDEPHKDPYIIQDGKFISDFTYSRIVGGTTMHFESKTPRMLPEDFKMKTTYGHGLDWPISYDDLMPYYIKAEHEIGVSGDVESQKFTTQKAYDEDYVFPMHELPPSYLDTVVGRDLNGLEVDIEDEKFTIHVTTFPQGRNGIPNVKYKKFNKGELFKPFGAVGLNQVETGGRCQGNTNCTPICPVQAKYDARKTLARALVRENVDFLSKAVASRVIVDETGLVTGIEVKRYETPDAANYETKVIKGNIFILAANAVENARLMLASGLPSSSDMVGRNLMDHPYLLAWGLLPEAAGTTRGTVCTSGISNLRNGDFRKKQAAFAVDIHNDGWGWATGSPYTDLINIVDNKNKFGKELRKELIHQVSKQLLLANMVEMEPDKDNRVTVDPAYTDHMGNPKPVVTMKITDYAMEGIAFARQLSKRIFQRVGAEDYSAYSELDYGYVKYKGQGYAIRGGNHLAGTHIMGDSPETSVVNSRQRSWDHKNLYLVGAGSMPTIGTSNTTLTLAALCYMSLESILTDVAEAHNKNVTTATLTH